MQLLEDRIRKDGKVREGNVLKVDSFLNHQMDVNLFREIGKEFQRRFAGGDHENPDHRGIWNRNCLCCG